MIDHGVRLARWAHERTLPPISKAYKAAGGETMRYRYDLGPSSVVFDVGGYVGDFAAEMLARYGCRVHCFEPLKPYADAVRERLGRNPNLLIHEFGLSNKTQEVMFSLEGPASSSLMRDGQSR